MEQKNEEKKPIEQSQGKSRTHTVLYDGGFTTHIPIGKKITIPVFSDDNKKEEKTDKKSK